MATFAFTLQGSTPTTIGATDILQFAGASGFGTAITVNSYNDTTHVESSGGSDQSSGNTPNNNKFVSQTGGTGGDSQADWGGGTEDLDQITTAEASLKINFSHGSAVALTNVIFYAYDASTTTAVPTDVDFRCAEVGDTNFVEAEGSGSALSLNDSSSNTSHDFYLVVSASPTDVGTKTAFAIRMELTYS